MTSTEITAISVSGEIPAPPREVYAILTDYRDRHPRILPRPPFVSLDVKEGGIGAGTIIHVRMRLLGRDTAFDAVVEEPEPGRILEEHNSNGYVTRFMVEPAGAEDRSRVTIETRTPPRPLGLGALERWLVRRWLREAYQRELGLLAKEAISGNQG